MRLFRILSVIIIIFLSTSTQAFSQSSSVFDEGNVSQSEETSDTDTTTTKDTSGNNEFDLYSDEQNNDETLNLENTGSGNSNIFFMLLVLCIFIGVIYLIIRWIAKKKNVSISGSEFAKVEGTKALALNKYLQLVSIGNKYYILGIGDHAVNLIKELDDEEQIDQIKLDISRSKTFKPFVNQFKKSLMNIIGLNKSNKGEKPSQEVYSGGGAYGVDNKKVIIEENINQDTNVNKPQKKNNIDYPNIIEKESKKLNANQDFSENEDKQKKIITSSDYKLNYDVFDNYGDEDVFGKNQNEFSKKTSKNEDSKNEELDEDKIIDDDTFEFIKKQRERLANLGIEVKKE